MRMNTIQFNNLLRDSENPIDDLLLQDMLLRRMLYRKDKDQLSVWHFCENCPLWPQTNYVEVHAPILEECERLCVDASSLNRRFTTR